MDLFELYCKASTFSWPTSHRECQSIKPTFHCASTTDTVVQCLISPAQAKRGNNRLASHPEICGLHAELHSDPLTWSLHRTPP